MKKLNLDNLRVETFATTGDAGLARGTVLGAELKSLAGCPVSYGGTCVISGCRPCDRMDGI